MGGAFRTAALGFALFSLGCADEGVQWQGVGTDRNPAKAKGADQKSSETIVPVSQPGEEKAHGPQ